MALLRSVRDDHWRRAGRDTLTLPGNYDDLSPEQQGRARRWAKIRGRTGMTIGAAILAVPIIWAAVLHHGHSGSAPQDEQWQACVAHARSAAEADGC